jgi:hypothetical protein
MITTPIPMPSPQAESPQSEYLRALLAQQGNTAGMTQMAPNLSGATPPVQREFRQPGSQQTSAFGVGEKGAHQRESMQNLVKASQSFANKIGEEVQARQNRDYQVTIKRFTDATQGVAQAQAQVIQATQALRQNPQDPQDPNAQATLQAAQAALKQNQTILNDMANDKKHAKIITKAFGIDDKNASSPERQAAMEVLKKQGMSQGAAGIMSQIPQTQQLSPQAQAQQQMVQAGVIGKPATQGQLLAADTSLTKTAMTEQGKNERQQQEDVIRRERMGLDAEGKPIPLEDLPEKDRAKINEERSNESYRDAMKNYAQARQEALQNPNSPQNRINALRAEGTMLRAKASMMGAMTGRMSYDMRAFGTDIAGNPLPGSVQVGGLTVGTSVAPNVEKVISQQAAFTDIRGAVKNLQAAGEAMKTSGASINDPNLVQVMAARDNGTFSSLLNSYVGNTLTSQQRDYAIAYHQAVENVSALRSTLKGSTAQANIERMVKTLPGPGTPNYDYANAQIQAIYGQLDRLSTGIANVNVGGDTAKPTGGTAQPKTAPAKSGGFDWNKHPVATP